MTPERWRQITAIFQAALQREPAEHAAFLADACGNDDELRGEVDSLMVAHREGVGFGSTPLFVASKPLEPGRSFGPYRIEGLVGAGGMGEVYRARDTKLGRSVAVKVLRGAFAGHERLSRFEREARVLASLNHPNVATIHGVEDSDGVPALVMELVEGPTLADRIAEGPIPIDEALPIAKQIAEALEAAHELGIIHRDLKPANIKVRPDGMVKVLDFGLAKALEPVPAPNADAAASPIITSPAMTELGVILGTAAYMSPEQARGKTVDTRTDIWSFGCVFYEMLTGRQPFQGDTPPDVLASVLVREPDLAKLPPDLSPRIPELIKRCLDKSPRKRWQAVGDLRAEIEAIATTPRAAVPDATQSAGPLWRRATLVSVTAIGTAAICAVIAWALWPARPPAPILSRFAFTLPLPEGHNVGGGRHAVVISPDGSRIVYVANRRLYLRSMSELEARAIPGTEASSESESVSNPVFSPDGQSIVFWSGVTGVALGGEGVLKRMAIDGGAAVTIGPARSPFGVSWAGDQILVGQSAGIVGVSDKGGRPELLVGVKNGEQAHGPQMLPGGHAVLFTLAKDTDGDDRWDKAQIVVHQLKSDLRKTVLEGGSDARYLPTGHIVYAVAGVVFAIPFDLQRLQVTGRAVPVLEGVRRPGAGAYLPGTAHFSVSGTGSLVYIAGPASTSTVVPRELALFDRKGGVDPLNLPPGGYDSPRISPDGKRVVYQADAGKQASVWIYDLSGTSAARRLTSGGNDRLPIWSANGERVAFQSDREGHLGIFWQRADGIGPAERLTKPDKGISHVPESWSPSGDWFLFRETKGQNVTLRTFSLKDKTEEPFGGVQSGTPTNAVFSPDGRWVAYFSNQLGRTSLWVQPFPATGSKYEISPEGDSLHALWSPDGKELFYTRPWQLFGRRIMTQPTFMFGNPVPIPTGPLVIPGAVSPRTFDIAPDGKLVGLVTSSSSRETEADSWVDRQIHVFLNWQEELKRLVPTK